MPEPSLLAGAENRRAVTVFAAASCAFLFLAAFAGSAGLRVGALLVCLVALAAALRRDALLLLRDELPRALIIAYAAWCAIAAASIAWSVHPPYTRGEVQSEVLYGVLAFAVFFVGAARDPGLWRAWRWALFAGAAAAFAGQMLQILLPFAISRHDVDGGAGPYSTHLVLILPLLFPLAWPVAEAHHASMRGVIVAFLLVIGAAAYTANRAVWVAFGVQLGVLVWTWHRSGSNGTHDMALLRRLAALAGVVIALAFAATMVERYERLFQLAPHARATVASDLRPRIWSVAIERFEHAPWLGHGFGREILADDFRPLTPVGVDHPEILHGHNAFLDVALELGIVGLATFVAVLVLLLLRYRALLLEPGLAPLGTIGLALVAGFVVKNLTDDFFHRHNALVFWALNGMLLGLARSRAAERQSR